MSETYCTMPIAECPGCSKTFQWDDYYDVQSGSETECPHCNCAIIVTMAERLIEVALCVKP